MAFSFSTPSSSSTAPKPFSFNTPASAAPSTPFSFATPAASTSNTNQNNTPSLFGQPNAGSSSAGTLFGTGGNAAGQSATTGLFGAAAPKSKQQPATGGLFGSAPAPASTGNNLFGQPQPQQNATGLFGNTAGSSLFGQPAQSQAQPTTGLFGSANQPFGQNSLFSQQPPQQSQPNTGSFGSQPQQNTFGSGLFGSTANQGGSSSLFGQNQQQQPSMQNSLFAGSAPALGSSQMPNSSLAQSVIGMNASQNALSQQQDEPIDQRILKIKNAYDPNNLSANAFQAYVYNVMDQQRANYVAQNGGKHTRTPQDTQNDALWLKAQRENPDPNRYYPQLIVGHDALKKRVAQQEDFAQKHKAKLEVRLCLVIHPSNFAQSFISFLGDRLTGSAAVFCTNIADLHQTVQGVPQSSCPLCETDKIGRQNTRAHIPTINTCDSR